MLTSHLSSTVTQAGTLLFSDKKKFLIIDFNYNCGDIKELHEAAGLEFSQENLLISLIRSVKYKQNLFDQTRLYFNFFPDNLKIDFSKSLFVKETLELKTEYLRLATILFNIFSSLGCYDKDILPYQFGCVVDDSAIMVHIVSASDIVIV